MRRFETLDAMRGVAAIIVMLFHATIAQSRVLWCAYLAVDFFFMLSGFVLSAAYDRRFRTGLNPLRFMWIRIRRLWPIMAVGILAGAAVALSLGMKPDVVGLRLIAQLLFLPVVLGTFHLYLLNPVQWSLLFELVVNAVHPLLKSTGVVIGVAVLSLGILAISSALYGSIQMGEYSENFFGGFPRAMFAYCVGMLLYRFDIRVSAPAWLPITMLVGVILLASVASLFTHEWMVGLLVVTVAFPLLIALGAGAELSSSRGLGAISYPLYAIHPPAIWAGVMLYGPGMAGNILGILLALTSAVVLAATMEPPRRPLVGLLTKRFWSAA